MAQSQDNYYARLEEKMANLPDHEIRRFQRFLERRGRAASEASVHDVQEFNTGICKYAATKIVETGNLAVFVKSFRT